MKSREVQSGRQDRKAAVPKSTLAANSAHKLAIRRPFAVFDIDGTLIRWQLYHAVVDALARHDLIDSKLYDQVRSARLSWKTRTHAEAFKEYERQLVHLYEATLLKLTPEQLTGAVENVFAEYKDQVYRYTRKLIEDLKRKNYLLFAISNSQSEIVEKIAAYYGFDDFAGTVYQHQKGRYTGHKKGFFGTKHIVLEELMNKHKMGLGGSIAVGDSESDISMLDMVEQPIAFNPTRKLFEHARQREWRIVVERKNVIYSLEPSEEGYYLK